jgi:hypothetical protein
MSAALLLRHARRMCRGFGSVPVAVAGNGIAPDGQPLRGLLMLPDRTVDDGMGGQALERFAQLTIPAADVSGVTRGTALLVDGVSRRVRDKALESDGVTAVLDLAPA